MSDVWNKMIKELGKFGDTVAEKSEVYIRKAVDKGEELSKLGKIQLEIETTKRDLRRKHEALGSYIAEKNSIENVSDFSLDENFNVQINEILNLKNLIKKLEQDKLNIKNAAEEKPENSEENQTDNTEQSPTAQQEFHL